MAFRRRADLRLLLRDTASARAGTANGTVFRYSMLFLFDPSRGYFAARVGPFATRPWPFSTYFRDRTISLEITVLRDSESRAYTGLFKLPVAIVSQGNTVKNTEYSFANFLLASVVISSSASSTTCSIGRKQLITNPGALYAGRLPEYERAEKLFSFVIGELRKIQPNADYGRLMVGHSNGGDISQMFFAQTRIRPS